MCLDLVVDAGPLVAATAVQLAATVESPVFSAAPTGSSRIPTLFCRQLTLAFSW